MPTHHILLKLHYFNLLVALLLSNTQQVVKQIEAMELEQQAFSDATLARRYPHL